jgi:hypothetical protein
VFALPLEGSKITSMLNTRCPAPPLIRDRSVEQFKVADTNQTSGLIQTFAGD